MHTVFAFALMTAIAQAGPQPQPPRPGINIVACDKESAGLLAEVPKTGSDSAMSQCNTVEAQTCFMSLETGRHNFVFNNIRFDADIPAGESYFYLQRGPSTLSLGLTTILLSPLMFGGGYLLSIFSLIYGLKYQNPAALLGVGAGVGVMGGSIVAFLAGIYWCILDLVTPDVSLVPMTNEQRKFFATQAPNPPPITINFIPVMESHRILLALAATF